MLHHLFCTDSNIVVTHFGEKNVLKRTVYQFPLSGISLWYNVGTNAGTKL